MPEIAYINGAFCGLADAKVSIEDRGFQFSDGVYEVIVAYGDKPFMLDDHLARLYRSLALIDMHLDPNRYDVPAIITEGIRRAGFDKTLGYMQVTRGVQPRSHAIAPDVEPTVVATFKSKPVIPADTRARGISVMTVEEDRWAHCEIKSIGLLSNVLAKNRALRDGFDDALYVTSEGEVREATSSNIFAVESNNLLTPVTDESILHGVTRKYVLQCAASLGITVDEAPLPLSRLERAVEAFISSTVVDILPVSRINRTDIGDAHPGPVTSALYDAFLKGLPIAE